ncbi:MAG: right-handed parallel beta-helix repeat-containing protein, partial [Verrucomicrobiales bacterium]
FGKDSKKSSAIFEGKADGYFADNVGFDWQTRPIPELRVEFPTLERPPLWPQGLEPVGPARALWRVARLAGARPGRRDAIDRRIVEQALTGTARIIDSQDEVGGYPEFEPTTRVLEVPAQNRRAWLDELSAEVGVGE